MRRRVAPTSHYFRRCHQPKNRPVAIPTSVGAARSCQIVMLNSVSVILPPLLQWQRFAAILNLSRVKLAPVMLPVNTEQCAGFSLSSDKATGDQAPQHCASPGCPGLPLILLCSPVSAGLKNKKSQPCDRDSSDNVCVTGRLGLATNSGAEKCRIASDLRKPIVHLYCGFRWVERSVT